MAPKYELIKDLIHENIDKGIWPENSKLPNEKDLCKLFKVSSITVRRALIDLHNEGWVNRINGRGTFVDSSSHRRENGVDSQTPGKRIIYLGRGNNAATFWQDLMIGSQREAEQHRYTHLFYLDDKMVSDKPAFRRILEEQRPAGIVTNAYIPDSIINILKRRNIQLITIDFCQGDFDYVLSDNIGGSESAVRHLAEQGHRRIAHLTFRDSNQSGKERLEGYYRALLEIEETSNETYVYKFEYDESCDGLEEVLKENGELPFTAIQCATDFHALEVLKFCHKHHIRVPDDLAITGFANIPEIVGLMTPLTSVDQHSQQIGAKACGLLIDKIEGRVTEPVRERVACDLVVRKSSMCNLINTENIPKTKRVA